MRLIDADLVVEKAMEIINKSLDSDFLEDRLVADEVALFLAEFIANASTVDAVPVIRCKDCDRAHHYEVARDVVYCFHHGMSKQSDDFCSHGKRKDGE